jgi:isoquinoline 1-oxidoreductase subunit beta
MKRRHWLAGALTVSVLPGCALPGIPVIPKRPKPTLADAAGWVRFRDDRYTLFLPRVEMGQNIGTAFQQIACEELGVPWDAVALRLPTTREIGRVRATVGSESVKDFALPLARACATLREAVAAGHREGVIAPREVPLAELRSFGAGTKRWVGHAAPLAQAEAIVRGAPLYAADVRLPGMLYGRVLRAPVSPELASSPKQADDAAARAVPGFVALVRDPLLLQGRSLGLGLVARTPAALDQAEAALAVQWEIERGEGGEGGFEQADIDRAIDVDHRMKDGELRHSLANDRLDHNPPWDVDLRIDIPLAAHAPLEPRCAVAAFDGRALNLWVGSQDVFYQGDVVARRLGLDHTDITVHAQRVGGAFGGKTICTVELEAAVLARALRQPVKVQWTRAQEFQLGFHRPPSSHRLRARVQDGRLVDWWHAFASSHILFTNAALPAWLQAITDVIGDDGVARGAALPYRALRRRTEFDLVRLPVFTGPWRGLGAGPNGLAIESAIDECARHAKIDPVQFRLNHLDRATPHDARLARVLKRVAADAGWPQARAAHPTAQLRGRGVACGIYKAMSYAAVVAEVAVEPASGALQVTQLWCAHDCGRVIHPDQVRAQCEGNLVWGLGMVISDRLPVAVSRVAATTFADAPMPQLRDVPPMQVSLVDEGEAPSGAGETVIVAAAAAIANAVRDATGHRLQRFPVRADDLRGAAGG